MCDAERSTVDTRVTKRSKEYDYALLECDAQLHPDHLTVRTFAHVEGASDATGSSGIDEIDALTGAPLVLCAFQIGVQKDLPEFRQGTQIELGLMPAYGCKLSSYRHHLLYDVRSWCGDSGAALVMYEGEVVGMHISAANTLVDQLDRDKTVDEQLTDVAESLAAAASSTPQASVALLCHVFVQP